MFDQILSLAVRRLILLPWSSHVNSVSSEVKSVSAKITLAEGKFVLSRLNKKVVGSTSL